MEVDHFDPRKKKDTTQDYANLFLADKHCNGRKWKHWPSESERASGVRFLNCCEEVDYGAHIFEDPDTHELIGITPAGRYHIRVIDLNAHHLVKQRAKRAEIWSFLKGGFQLLDGVPYRSFPTEGLQLLQQVAESMIPLIPPPPDRNIGQAQKITDEKEG